MKVFFTLIEIASHDRHIGGKQPLYCTVALAPKHTVSFIHCSIGLLLFATRCKKCRPYMKRNRNHTYSETTTITTGTWSCVICRLQYVSILFISSNLATVIPASFHPKMYTMQYNDIVMRRSTKGRVLALRSFCPSVRISENTTKCAQNVRREP